MPNYYFKCNKCEHKFSVLANINEYNENNFSCSNCNSSDIKRLFGFSGFENKLSYEENINEIKKEVKKIVKKVKEGSVKHIRDIYGN